MRRIAGTSISPSFSSSIRRAIDVDAFDFEANRNRIEIILADIKQRVTDSLAQRESPNPRITRREEQEEDAVLRELIIDEFISDLREIFTERRDEQSKYSTSFGNVIKNAFRGEINNKRAENKKGVISLNHNASAILDCVFEDNIIDHMHVEESMLPELFEDATLLESPFVLNLRPSLNFFRGSYENPFNIEYTTSDLLQKLAFATSSAAPQSDDTNNTLEVNISNVIGKTIEGRIYFDQKRDDFLFLNDDKVEVRIANTASGVKTLGIIQMLATAGILNGTNLFIIDEPEVHLHPAWQIVCAEVIATLVAKYNVYCVVSSHSPYFLQAIEAYVSTYKMKHLTKFYLSEKAKGICTFQDVTQDTEPLYSLLAEPMKQIMYLRANDES